MSDSDNESDFESADEGDNGQPPTHKHHQPHQPHLATPTASHLSVDRVPTDTESQSTTRAPLPTEQPAEQLDLPTSAQTPFNPSIHENLVSTDTGPEAHDPISIDSPPESIAEALAADEQLVLPSSEALVSIEREVRGEPISDVQAAHSIESITEIDNREPDHTGHRVNDEAQDESQNEEMVNAELEDCSRQVEAGDGWEIDGDGQLSLSDDSSHLDEDEDGGEQPSVDRSSRADQEESPGKAAATRKLERRSGSRERVAVLEQLSKVAESRQTQSSWGSWGASLLATATSSVTTFTNQVGQGFSSVIEGVEATLGVPSPEELAAHVRKIEKEAEGASEPFEAVEQHAGTQESLDLEQPSQPPPSGLPLSMGNIVSGVGLLTSAIEQAGSKALSGGLDTLELIGRKTMDILQEGDPGLKKKRSFINAGTPNLSDVLKQVKEKANIDSGGVTKNDGEKQVHFGLIFDQCEGLVHIEALEMLSKQCKQKVEAALIALEGESLDSANAQLLKLKDACVWNEVDDADENSDQDFASLVHESLEKLNVSGSVNAHAFLKDEQDSRNWLIGCQAEQQKGDQKDPQELHSKAITCLATFTAQAIKVIHKICEVTLLEKGPDALQEISSFTRLVNGFCLEVAILSAKFSACLNVAADDSEDPDKISPMITNVYLEASNCNTYIQDTFELVVPIFQLKQVGSAQTKYPLINQM